MLLGKNAAPALFTQSPTTSHKKRPKWLIPQFQSTNDNRERYRIFALGKTWTFSWKTFAKLVYFGIMRVRAKPIT